MLGRRSVVLGLGVALGACGGHVRHDPNDDEPSLSGTGGASSAGAFAQGGMSGGGVAAGGVPTAAGAGAAAVGGGGVTSTLRGCPDATWGRCETSTQLNLNTAGPIKSPNGIWVEPLQVPSYPPMNTSTPPIEVAPEDWDRSALPAGACVFRVHGVEPDCFGTHGRLVYSACQEGMQVVPTSYYELPNCSRGISPGCAGADPNNGDNWIWYAVPDPALPNTTTIVVCAGICATAAISVGGAMCLRGAP